MITRCITGSNYILGPPQPRGYQTIAADPPWSFATWSKTRQTRAVENHYGVMSLDDICCLPVKDWAAPDCTLLLWTIDTMIPQAFTVMKAWGFTYKTVGFYWTKTNADGSPFCGMGYWTRANPEIALLGTRGAPKRLSKSVRRLIIAPRREHSRKPDEFYSRTQQLVSGPYLDMFARERRLGWDSWGNEVEKFSEAAE